MSKSERNEIVSQYMEDAASSDFFPGSQQYQENQHSQTPSPDENRDVLEASPDPSKIDACTMDKERQLPGPSSEINKESLDEPAAKVKEELSLDELLYDGDFDDYGWSQRKIIPYNYYIGRKRPSNDIAKTYICPKSRCYFCPSCNIFFKLRDDFKEHMQYDCGKEYRCSCDFSASERRLILTHIQNEHADEEDEHLEAMMVVAVKDVDPVVSAMDSQMLNEF